MRLIAQYQILLKTVENTLKNCKIHIFAIEQKVIFIHMQHQLSFLFIKASNQRKIQLPPTMHD